MRTRLFFHCCKSGIAYRLSSYRLSLSCGLAVMALMSSIPFIPFIACSRSQALEMQISPASGTSEWKALGESSDKPSIYKDGWIDLNKDGIKNVYEDPSQPVEKRVEDLLGRMTTSEKLGQLWKGPQATGKLQLDWIASGGLGTYASVPDPELRNTLQKAAVERSRLGIPLLFGAGEAEEAGGQVEQVEPVGLRDAKQIPPQELDDKVRKILRRKFLLGLFEKPYTIGTPATSAPAKGV